MTCDVAINTQLFQTVEKVFAFGVFLVRIFGSNTVTQFFDFSSQCVWKIMNERLFIGGLINIKLQKYN